MSLLGTLRQLSKLPMVQKTAAGSKISKFLSLHAAFLQGDHFNANGASLNDQYEDKTGEALNIVDQVNQLAETFTEDKQSSIDQEGELSSAFTSLMQQKQKLLAELVTQRDQQQSVLNQVNQEL